MIVISVQLVMKINSVEHAVLARAMKRRVLCRFMASDNEPPTREPITLDMVNTVVISPIWVIVSCRSMFINKGAARVIIPLFIEMRGRSIARESVVLFLNSFETILVILFCLFWVGGAVVNQGMMSKEIMMIPALMKDVVYD